MADFDMSIFHGLTINKLKILLAVKCAPDCHVSELARRLGMDRGALQRDLRWMMEDSLVSRQPHGGRVHIQLESRGNHILHALSALLSTALRVSTPTDLAEGES